MGNRFQLRILNYELGITNSLNILNHFFAKSPRCWANIPQVWTDMHQICSNTPLVWANMPQSWTNILHVCANLPQSWTNMPQVWTNMPQVCANMPQISGTMVWNSNDYQSYTYGTTSMELKNY